MVGQVAVLNSRCPSPVYRNRDAPEPPTALRPRLPNCLIEVPCNKWWATMRLHGSPSPTTSAQTDFGPALNESRGQIPGNPWQCCVSPDALPHSTKAGGNPRQPRSPHDPVVAHVARSTKARVETPATHCGTARCASTCTRSTKARAETPATRLRAASLRSRCTALNKGQGRNPGNPRPVASSTASYGSAQQRPGSKPRQPAHAGMLILSGDFFAQQRPGSKPRQP